MKHIKSSLSFLTLILTSFLLSNQAYGQSKKETPFTLITYNIRYNNPGDGVNAWPARKDKVAGLLRFHKADIFNVQEALIEQVNDLKISFPDFDYYGLGRDDGKEAGEHMSVFFRKSRFEKLAEGTFWLSETPDKPGMGWDAACNRTCTWLKLRDKITKKIFFVFNTHLDHRGTKAREEGVALILNRITEINRENLPLILTGDFNLVKESNPVSSILTTLSDSRDKSLTASYGPDATSGGFAVSDRGRTIDFIFINDKIKILRHGVLSDSFGMFYPSDHKPVLAEIQIP
ncbi:MAG TPA: endonuclease/exonuclease/phosphatase family protein [Bacteroidales bacterium]|jgi:endonuclease/exonuclease/phosphatase family metal-dependent hydrolase|nr:endonuclease/exonuclease/phosphatase family protein [Bacteroidales bacterium]HQH22749.1 endonuclease/exonuclease/phosphatase family protein [Bacteroidales bacterium]HQJ83105.1 endonuclease/exonuclease/phosphatase family protein [Bacteroidales bacterium]